MSPSIEMGLGIALFRASLAETMPVRPRPDFFNPTLRMLTCKTGVEACCFASLLKAATGRQPTRCLQWPHNKTDVIQLQNKVYDSSISVDIVLIHRTFFSVGCRSASSLCFATGVDREQGDGVLWPWLVGFASFLGRCSQLICCLAAIDPMARVGG
jgi:hypothetical protein